MPSLDCSPFLSANYLPLLLCRLSNALEWVESQTEMKARLGEGERIEVEILPSLYAPSDYYYDTDIGLLCKKIQ